ILNGAKRDQRAGKDETDTQTHGELLPRPRGPCRGRLAGIVGGDQRADANTPRSVRTLSGWTNVTGVAATRSQGSDAESGRWWPDVRPVAAPCVGSARPTDLHPLACSGLPAVVACGQSVLLRLCIARS